MTRTFIFSWSGRFENTPVSLDPVGLDDWNCPLTMLYWVAGQALYGHLTKFEEPRRSDTIENVGPGKWKGQFHSRPFTLEDSLFVPVPEKKIRKKPKTPYALDIEAANGLRGAGYQEYVAVNIDQPVQAQVNWVEVGRPQMPLAGPAPLNFPEIERRLWLGMMNADPVPAPELPEPLDE